MFSSRMLVLAAVGLCVMAAPIHAQPAKAETPSSRKTLPQSEKPNFPLDSLTEFSAIMVGGLLGNIDELHIYRSGKLMRTEMLDGNYMVTNLETRTTFAVLPKQCGQDPRPSVNTFPFSLVTAEHKVERNLLGTEVMEGHTCQVEEVTLTPKQGQPIKLKFWEASDLSGFPIKLEVYHAVGPPTTITYKEVKIGPPDPALFKIPASCSESATKKKSAGESSTSPSPKKAQ